MEGSATAAMPEWRRIVDWKPTRSLATSVPPPSTSTRLRLNTCAMSEAVKPPDILHPARRVRTPGSGEATPSSDDIAMFTAVQASTRSEPVTQAWTSLPLSPGSDMEKPSTPGAAKGSAARSSHGRKRPQRVRVRSASTPTMGSFTASQSRVTRNIVPAASGLMPGTSV